MPVKKSGFAEIIKSGLFHINSQAYFGFYITKPEKLFLSANYLIPKMK